MGMTLIIAEKPSLARNIVAGIDEKMEKRNGYFAGQRYLVSWAFGHLFSLVDVEAYGNGSVSGWTLDNLPCFPRQFRFELRREGTQGGRRSVDAGVARQFELLRTLCRRADVDTIVNAGDADREGEIIVRLCIQHALADGEGDTPAGAKSLRRLWLPDQTPQTVRRALEELQPEEAYDNLANEGFARTYIDWLYGVNLTRYATIRTGKLLRVGRVIVPIVQAIYERDKEIREFKPEPYYVIASSEKTNGEKIELTSKQRFTKDEIEKARERAAAYNAAGATVTAASSKEDILFPGKLYSLSTLQNVLGKKYKMSMAESLRIVQKLYEEGYLTYPRTNSEYLATAEREKIRTILAQVGKLGYPVRFRDSKHIFDDSKIESHSALTPTYRIPARDALSEAEAQVYGTVMRRFVAVFCAEECRVERSELHIAVGALEEFTLKGTVILTPGWTRYDDYTQKDKLLPKLAVGDPVNILFQPTEKMTTPPRHYTIETLNNYLKNPFKEDKARARELAEGGEIDDAEDYRAMFEGLELGTEATRTGIIDNAKRSGYIDLRRDVYTIKEGGEYLIESLARLSIRMDKYKTSELGRALKRVFHAEMTVEESVALAEREIAEIFRCGGVAPTGTLALPSTGAAGQIVGVCPRCGRHVVRGRYRYGCMGYKEGCDFHVGITVCKKIIGIEEVSRLLSEGRTSLLHGFVSSKSGRCFDAYLALREGEVTFVFP